jgi:hypothetical protein
MKSHFSQLTNSCESLSLPHLINQFHDFWEVNTALGKVCVDFLFLVCTNFILGSLILCLLMTNYGRSLTPLKRVPCQKAIASFQSLVLFWLSLFIFYACLNACLNTDSKTHEIIIFMVFWLMVFNAVFLLA